MTLGKPMSQMTDEELKEMINKIRAVRTSAQTLKAEVALGSAKSTAPRKAKAKQLDEYDVEPDVDLSEYS
jgi:hypothetical protein